MRIAFIFLGVLAVLFAVCSARPLVFVSEQLDTSLTNTTNGWSGTGMIWVTQTKGKLNHRLRVFGVTNINETVTGAFVAHINGTILARLGIPVNTQLRYYSGVVPINETVYGFVLNRQAQIIVTSTRFPKGAVGGIIYSVPGMGLTFLDGSQAGTTSTASGMGLVWINIPGLQTNTLPADLVQQTTTIATGALFSGIVISNVTSPTGASYHAPANLTSTAPALFNLAVRGSSPLTAFTISNAPVTTEAAYAFFTANAYYQVTDAAGVQIRGQVFPILGLTRRSIPSQVQTVYGTTDPSDNFETLRYANQEFKEKNPNSFLSLSGAQINGTGNYTYQGEFFFPAATQRRNFETLRGLEVELNLKLVGTPTTWSFDYFDASTGAHVNIGTFSTASADWTPVRSFRFTPDAASFTNNRGQLVIRVTASAPTPIGLWVDLFGVRSAVPTALFNQVFKGPLKLLLALPTQ